VPDVVKKQRTKPTWGLTAGLVGIAVAGGAAAQTSRSIRVEYEGPAACSDRHAFEEQIRARSARIVWGADGATLVRVHLSGAGAGTVGEVTIVDPSGQKSHRRVEGACNDVVSALALIAAVALDPLASTAAGASAAPSAAASSSSSSAAPPPPPSASAAPEPPKPEPSATSRPAENPPPSPPSEHSSTHVWAWSIGVHAGLTAGVAPPLLVSVPLFVDISRRTESPFAPAFRLRAVRSNSGSGNAGVPNADFTWTLGTLDACPLGLPGSPDARFRLVPCVRFEVGLLEAQGLGVTPTRSSARPWVAGGGAARASLWVVGGLFLEVEGGLVVPLLQDRFFVEPNTTLHVTPALVGSGAAGFRVSFW
jgi:hypothetical protein